MPGLERLFRRTFGETPQIDLDAQIVRCRVPAAMTLDFAALAEGMTRNNVGHNAIIVQANATVADGKVQIKPTGQTFALEGEAPPAEAGWRTFDVLDYATPAKTRLRWRKPQ